MFKSIGDLLFPTHCPFCYKIIPKDNLLCSDCKKKVVDGLNFKTVLKNSVCVSAFPYSDIYRNAILRFKFGKAIRSASCLSLYISKAVRECYKDESIDFITAVPLSIKQKNARGFNHAEILARNLSEVLDIPYKECLIKTKENLYQHKLNQKDRKQNVKGVYDIASDEIKNLKILLIDDIITTGCTLEECCKILNKSHNKVLCATFCKTKYM